MIRQPLLPPPQTTLLQPAMPVICQTPVIQAVPIRMAPTLQPQSQPPPTQIIDPRFQQTRIPPIQQTQVLFYFLKIKNNFFFNIIKILVVVIEIILSSTTTIGRESHQWRKRVKCRPRKGKNRVF